MERQPVKTRFIRRFPANDRPPRENKDKLRAQVDSDIDQFLAKGGEITSHDSSEYNQYNNTLTQKQMRKHKRQTYTFGRGKCLKL